MRLPAPVLSWSLVIATSLGAHAAVFGGLRAPGAARAATRRAPTLVEMTVPPPPPAVATPAEPARPRAAPVARRIARAAPAHRPSAAPPPSAPPPEAPPAVQAETPADFTGTTLTAGAGAGWASATGNGAAMRGPAGAPGARVAGRRAAPSAGGVDEGPPVVGAADLSRPPEAPDLTGALERLYPPEARRNGMSGRAVVRAIVLPDGRLRDLSVVSATAPAFGDACRQALRASVWTAPVSRDGKPAATAVAYTCRFEVK